MTFTWIKHDSGEISMTHGKLSYVVDPSGTVTGQDVTANVFVFYRKCDTMERGQRAAEQHASNKRWN